jgi:hypothetical protein
LGWICALHKSSFFFAVTPVAPARHLAHLAAPPVWARRSWSTWSTSRTTDTSRWARHAHTDDVMVSCRPWRHHYVWRVMVNI